MYSLRPVPRPPYISWFQQASMQLPAEFKIVAKEKKFQPIVKELRNLLKSYIN